MEESHRRVELADLFPSQQRCCTSRLLETITA
jgi:hypothetical protein